VKVWAAIPESHTVSFLGLDWSSIITDVQKHIKMGSVSLALLSELQLSTAPGFAGGQIQRNQHFSLYEKYSHYSIRILDFGENGGKYIVPLMTLAVAHNKGLRPGILFEDCDPKALERSLPLNPRRGRLVVFPQTRYSFLEDDVSITI
jgi:hypothetical protein